MEELRQQTEDYVMGRELEAQILPVASGRGTILSLNLIPQIDVFTEDGYTKEEWK